MSSICRSPSPHISFSSERNNQLNWYYRTRIPTSFLEERKTATGYIKVSNPELTVLDLVQYCDKSGGLSSVATMIAELSDTLDFSKDDGSVLLTASSATIQRLGYIMEITLGQHDKANSLCEFWHQHFKRQNYALLNSKAHAKPSGRNERWKIDINATVEVDDM